MNNKLGSENNNVHGIEEVRVFNDSFNKFTE